MPTTIFDLPQLLARLPKKEKELFDAIFTHTTDEAPLAYDSIGAKKHVEEIFQTRLSSRKTLRITNRVFGQETLFNPIRSHKPFHMGKMAPTKVPSQDSCDLCHITKKTPRDPFGRITTGRVTTAANAGAYVGLHSLIVPDVHNPLEISQDVFLEMVEVANTWLKKARQYNPNAIFPSLIWNVSSRAGASLFHPHMQIMLTEKPFHKTQLLDQNIAAFEKKEKVKFFSTYLSLMQQLGLCYTSHNINIVGDLTPIRENNVLLFDTNAATPFLSADFGEALFETLSSYKKLGMTSFNLGITLPSFAKKSNLCVYASLTDRGKEGKPSDVAGMELFFASVVSTDPFVFAKKLF